MAGEIQLNSTTFATESGGTITVANVDSATNRTNLGLGSIATQEANSVDIDGGAIDGTTIGGSSAAAGTFTTLNTSGNVTLGGNLVIPNSGTIGSVSDTDAMQITNNGALMYSVGVYAASKRTSLTLTGDGSTYDTLFDLWVGNAGRGQYLVSVTRLGASVATRALVIVASSTSSASVVYTVLESNGITVGVSGSNVTAMASVAYTVNAIAIPLAIDGN